MLEPQVVANLSQQACVSVEFVSHGYCVHFNVVPSALPERQGYGDQDYSEGDKLDQIIRPFSVGISVTEEMRRATAQRLGSFHGYITPFTNEKTISWQLNGQLF